MFTEIYFHPDYYEDKVKEKEFYDVINNFFYFVEDEIITRANLNELQILLDYDVVVEESIPYLENIKVINIIISLSNKNINLLEAQSKELLKEIEKIGFYSDDEIEALIWENIEASQEDHYYD